MRLFLFLLLGLRAASPGPWTDAIRNAECKDLVRLKVRLLAAIQAQGQICDKGGVLNQSDKCRGVDFAEALGEVRVRSGECRREKTDFPWL